MRLELPHQTFGERGRNLMQIIDFDKKDSAENSPSIANNINFRKDPCPHELEHKVKQKERHQIGVKVNQHHGGLTGLDIFLFWQRYALLSSTRTMHNKHASDVL